MPSIRAMHDMLAIRDLQVSFATQNGEVAAVREFSLSIAPGECVGIVGESGAGKSQAMFALMGLLPANALVRGQARFESTELIGATPATLDRIRGASITMIFQDALTALTPHMRIGDQVAEPLVHHKGMSWSAGRDRALELLRRVHITDPERRMRQYPHELSGGMRQRVMIAIALACEPKLVIADEPTTALDVTIQAQILSLLAELKRERGMSLVLVTHDLGVVAGLADRIVVMRGGRILEEGSASAILTTPQNPYTQELLRASQGGERVPDTVEGPVLLDTSDLGVRFGAVRALEGVGLSVRRGEVVGIVGESGSGKSTFARAILQLVKPHAGTVVWMGRPLGELTRGMRRDLQLVFQDPFGSLDPRMTVREIISEPLEVHQPELDPAPLVSAMIQRVGLDESLLTRFPHELSGGQCQRVGIARAMILKPALLICDEAVSALDVSIQAQIVRLLQSLKHEFGTTILFISHNLAVVQQLCDRVLVLYLGHMMEEGSAEELFHEPRHPYTRGLLEAIPIADPALQPARLGQALGGELPSPTAPPSGCVFRTRCPYAIEVCRERVPAWESDGTRRVACHRWRELAILGS
jgi:peptide/nickel transport system ATP-binding protein